MTGVVIVGYEGSDRSKDALAFGEVLAAAEDAGLIVACVHPLQPRTSAIGAAGFDREVRSGAQRTAESARGLLTTAERVEFTAVLGLSAADGVAALARERDASAIVVGSSRRGAAGLVHSGTVGRRLVHEAPCPVGIAPAGYAGDRHAAVSLVGAAFDGSPESERALHLAERISAGLRGRLQVVAVTESDGNADPVLSELTDAVLTAPVSVRAKGDLRRGDPARELSRASAELDLLVCGSRGYGRARGLVLGSVSSVLMGSARCPMLVVQRA